MQILSDIEQFSKDPAGALTVGKFDGVHLGHQKILHEASLLAGRWAGPLVVMTFHPHPQEFLHPEQSNERLMDREDLVAQMKSRGVDVLIVQNFNAKFATQTAGEFLDNLVHFTSLKSLVVGPDFRFGKGQGGSLQDLESWAQKSRVELKRVLRVQVDGIDISSTSIKQSLKDHCFELAEKMLGRKYYIRGEVVRGEGRGRTLNIPTANFVPTVTPPLTTGVYAGWALLPNGLREKAVMNVGRKPTFWRDKEHPITFECHILNWSGDLYDQKIGFEPHQFLREERKFSDVQELKDQIQKDIAASQEVLK
jgi:riboflavin kinase/FMN adenylyltransferase